jgi:photosystem II stability/assembly factor-like uncharacterized protein
MIHQLLQIAFCTLAVLRVGLPDPCNAQEWRSIGPWGGSVTSIASDRHLPGHLLASGRGCLLYFSKDAAAQWSLLRLPREMSCEIAATLIDPNNPLHFLVGVTGSSKAGLWESRDGGNTWTPHAAFASLSVRALASSASNPAEIVAGSSRGVFLSLDSGGEWRRISDPGNAQLVGITAAAIDPHDEKTIYAGTPHLAWKTSDQGKSWISIAEGMIDDSDIFSIFVDPDRAGYLLASACSGIYRSSDGGNTWHKVAGIANTYRRTHVIAQDPGEASILYAGTTLGLLRSNDSGTTWRQVSGIQVNSLTFDAGDRHRLYIASEDGIWTSADRGENLNPVNSGFVARSIRSAAELSGNRLFTIDSEVGDGTAVFESNDGGETWNRIEAAGLDGIHLTHIAGFSDILVASDANRVYLSKDDGRSWTAIVTSSGLSDNELQSARINQVQIVGRSGQPLILTATDQGLFESGDLGKQWRKVLAGGSPEITDIYFSTPEGGRVLLRSTEAMYLSNDGGQTWERLCVPVDLAEVNDVAIPASNDAPILFATKKGLLESRNHDTAWVFHSEELPLSTVTSVAYDRTQSAHAYALQFGNIFETRDGGNSWTMLSKSPSSLCKLWTATGFPDRLFGFTNDLGIVLRAGL